MAFAGTVAALVVFVSAAIAGLLRYRNDRAAEAALTRLQAYDTTVSVSPLIAMNIQNDDRIPLNGTGVFDVVLRPTADFARRLARSRRPGDELELKVRLMAPSFGVTPTLDEVQPYSPEPHQYYWLVTGDHTGNQFLYVRGIAYWRTASGAVHDRWTFGSAIRVIEVTNPLVPLSTANWVTLGTAALGSGGVLALIQLFRSRGTHDAG